MITISRSPHAAAAQVRRGPTAFRNAVLGMLIFAGAAMLAAALKSMI